jgi:hypothetical protein
MLHLTLKNVGQHPKLMTLSTFVLDCIVLGNHNMITGDLYMISSAGMERRHNKPQHQGSTKEVTPQDTIETITKLVEGTTADHATG